MITLPPSSANGFYSSWRTSPEIASPTTSDGFSPPGSPPGSPSLMMALPGAPANGVYSTWNHYAERSRLAKPGRLSSSMSRPPSPPHTINQVLSQRASWPVTRPLPEQPKEQPNPEGRSRPTSSSTSISFSYTVRSINSRKSRLTVIYRRPVRPKRASCGVEAIAESESAGLSTESLVPLSSRPVSLSVPPHRNRRSIVDREVSVGGQSEEV